MTIKGIPGILIFDPAKIFGFYTISRLGFGLAMLLGCWSCKPGVNTYKNNMGIDPSIIAQMDSANYTRINWTDTLFDFGTVHEGDSVIVHFRFTNSGGKALFITSAHSTCGCASVEYPRDAVLPGESGQIIARFMNKYRPGPVRQTLMVTSNTKGQVHRQLAFVGQVADSIGASR